MEAFDADDAELLRLHGWHCAIRPQFGEAIWVFRQGTQTTWALPQSQALATVQEWAARSGGSSAATANN